MPRRRHLLASLPRALAVFAAGVAGQALLYPAEIQALPAAAVLAGPALFALAACAFWAWESAHGEQGATLPD